MTDLSTRSTRCLLGLAGAATLAVGLAGLLAAPDVAGRQVGLLTVAAGSALLAATGWTALRLPALALALVLKSSYLVAWGMSGAGAPEPVLWVEAVLISMLGSLAAALLAQARREARWNGGQFLRLEP